MHPSPRVLARRLTLALLGAALLVSAALLPVASPARAQLLDSWGKPATFEIVQDGTVVGADFVAVWHAAGGDLPAKARYVEHWVLDAGYAYPSPANGKAVTVRPAPHQRYSSEADFFARVPWGAGCRYVRVDCTDGTRRPGR